MAQRSRVQRASQPLVRAATTTAGGVCFTQHAHSVLALTQQARSGYAASQHCALLRQRGCRTRRTEDGIQVLAARLLVVVVALLRRLATHATPLRRRTASARHAARRRDGARRAGKCCGCCCFVLFVFPFFRQHRVAVVRRQNDAG
jgi:hypothetical protein